MNQNENVTSERRVGQEKLMATVFDVPNEMTQPLLNGAENAEEVAVPIAVAAVVDTALEGADGQEEMPRKLEPLVIVARNEPLQSSISLEEMEDAANTPVEI